MAGDARRFSVALLFRDDHPLHQEIHEHTHSRREPGMPDIQRVNIFTVGLDEFLQ